ncbi:MAG: Asd/ArgC dimerization domain-containing protein [Simkaniaceae bacterium]
MRKKRIALIGASGLVGRELLKLIQEENLPWDLSFFASKKRGAFDVLTPEMFDDFDLAFFCTSSEVSKKWIPYALKSTCQTIDLSSAYRLNPNYPLVIPEINGEELKKNPKLVSSPNCTTTLMLLALYPLDPILHIQKVVASTYQAMSGSGIKGLKALESAIEKGALSVFPHESSHDSEAFSGEEEKMIFETRKILNKDLDIHPIAIRVPVKRAHSLSLYIEGKNEVDLSRVKKALDEFHGIKRVENAQLTSEFASEQRPIFCGRIRKDFKNAYALSLFVVGDQLLKGAALNAFQCAKILLKNKTFVYNSDKERV